MADPLAGDAHREDLAQMQLAINGPNHFKDAKEAGKVLPEYGRATPADMIPNMRFEYVKLSQDVAPTARESVVGCRTGHGRSFLCA